VTKGLVILTEIDSIMSSFYDSVIDVLKPIPPTGVQAGSIRTCSQQFYSLFPSLQSRAPPIRTMDGLQTEVELMKVHCHLAFL
jgi:hypothetical protein